MVQVDPINNQMGQMVLQEDGAVLSSSGELASNEALSGQIMNLTYHSFPSPLSSTGAAVGNDSQDNSIVGLRPKINLPPLEKIGSNGAGERWNRVSVSFGPLSYTACMSNRKVFIVKRESAESNP